MTEPLPGRPIRSTAPHRLEKFHVYLFLVLGIALVGVGLTVMGFATISPAVVGIGAGTLVAAGLIAFYFALAGSRLTVEEKRAFPPTTFLSRPLPQMILILRANALSGRSERHGKFLTEIALPIRALRANFARLPELVRRD
jgi:hypothetical protein